MQLTVLRIYWGHLENYFHSIRIAIDNWGRYTASMTTMSQALCNANVGSPAMRSGASPSASYVFYYAYAYQAMLEVRSSDE